MLLAMVERGELTMRQAFGNDSEVNPMSHQGAVGGNRQYEGNVTAEPAKHERNMRQTMRKIEEGKKANKPPSDYEKVIARRQELVVRTIMHEMMLDAPSFPNDAAFMEWARTELRRRIAEQTRLFFQGTPRTFMGLFGALPVGSS